MTAYDRWLETQPNEETAESENQADTNYLVQYDTYCSEIGMFGDAVYAAISSQSADIDIEVLAAFNAGDALKFGCLLWTMIFVQIDKECTDFAERNIF